MAKDGLEWIATELVIVAQSTFSEEAATGTAWTIVVSSIAGALNEVAMTSGLMFCPLVETGNFEVAEARVVDGRFSATIEC